MDKKNVNNLLTWIFYGIGIILIILTIRTWKKNQAINKDYFVAVDVSFNIGEFMNSDSFDWYGDKFSPDSNAVTALHLIKTTSCSGCTNEIIGYYRFLKDNGFMNMKVQQFVVVIDTVKSKALRFIKTSELFEPVMYGSDTNYTDFLRTFGLNVEDRQLILISNSKNKIFFRTVLQKSRMSSIKYKKGIIKEA